MSNTNLLKFIVLAFLAFALALPARAEYKEPTAKTNINQLDPLFENNISNYKGFEELLERQKASAVEGVKAEARFSDIANSNEAKAAASSLSGIRAEELEVEGLRAASKESWVNEYLVDYSRPGMMRHQEDAIKIANSTGKMLEGLASMLKKLGIECKQTKGNKEIEPQYYLQFAKELDRNKGDTIYDKMICEEPRSKYHCSDVLTVRCANRAPASFKAGTIRLSYGEMPAHWWVGRSGGGICYGAIQNTTNNFAVFAGSTEVLAELKQKIAAKIGNPNVDVPPQEIMFFGGKYIYYQLDEAGNRGYIQGTWHPNPETISGSVKFFYRAAQEEKCLHWHEEWREQCRLL